jgi:hypothetical protein
MKRTTILVCTLAAGMAWAQNPQVIQNTRTQMNAVQQNATAASNQALGIKSESAHASSAVKAKPPVKSSVATVKASAAPVKINAVAVKTAPVKAAASDKVAVKSATLKAGTTPAKATAPSAAAKVVAAKSSGKSVQPKTVSTSTSNSKKAEPFAEKKIASATPKLGVKPVKAKNEVKKVEAKKVEAAPKAPAAAAPAGSGDDVAVSSEEGKGDDDAVKEAQDKKWAMSGKRDPFISPVVSHAGGSGCSTGKKCLEIGAINLRGVVHSDGGFIAVVTNNLNKAYFLRENDPVFDGYVVKITGDSIVFKATMQDRLGKTFTREVTKKITTPAV